MSKEMETVEPTIESVEPTTAEPQVPAAEPTTEPTVGDVSTDETGDAAPKYEPNFKYRVLDQEKEFDKYFQSFIKSKEDEEKFRDLITKAEGLEPIKMEREEVKKKYESLNSEHSQIKSVLTNLKQAIDKGYFEDFFEAWGLNDEQIFKYALNRIKLQENPELRAHYEQSLTNRREASASQQEKELLQQQNQQMIQKQYEMELDYTMTRPETSEFSKKFDSLPGRKQGDFVMEVLKHGAYVYNTKGVDIPIMQAVQDVMSQYKYFVENFNKPTVQPTVKVVTQSEMAKPQTIPNVGKSSAQSPSHKKFTSIKDLEEEAARLTSEG